MPRFPFATKCPHGQRPRHHLCVQRHARVDGLAHASETRATERHCARRPVARSRPRGWRGRAHQPRGVALVHTRWWARAAAPWWTLVANGNRGIMITPLPGATPSTRFSNVPFFGIEPVVIDEQARSSMARLSGLCHQAAWPGMAALCKTSHAIRRDLLAAFHGYYLTGDGCRRDKDAITGSPASDDVINVSGHRLGTAEWRRPGHAPRVRRSRGRGLPARDQRPGHFRLREFSNRAGAKARIARELKNEARHHIGPFATPTSSHRARCQDPLGKDHAPNPAQHASGKHDDMGDITTWPTRRLWTCLLPRDGDLNDPWRANRGNRQGQSS